MKQELPAVTIQWLSCGKFSDISSRQEFVLAIEQYAGDSWITVSLGQAFTDTLPHFGAENPTSSDI